MDTQYGFSLILFHACRCFWLSLLTFVWLKLFLKIERKMHKRPQCWRRCHEIHLKFHYADEENICVWMEWKAHSHNILQCLIVFCIVVAHFPPNLIQFKIYSKLLFVVSVFFLFFWYVRVRFLCACVCVLETVLFLFFHMNWNWFRIFEIFVQDPLWRLVIIIIEIAMKWRKIIASVSL